MKLKAMLDSSFSILGQEGKESGKRKGSKWNVGRIELTRSKRMSSPEIEGESQ